MKTVKVLALPSLILLATAAFTACPPSPNPGPNPPPPIADATVDASPQGGDGANDATPGDEGSVNPLPGEGGVEGGVVPPSPGPSTIACQNACIALAAVGCRHGDTMYCAAVLTAALGDGHVTNPMTHRSLKCSDIALVKTTEEARALGFDCPLGKSYEL